MVTNPLSEVINDRGSKLDAEMWATTAANVPTAPFSSIASELMVRKNQQQQKKKKSKT